MELLVRLAEGPELAGTRVPEEVEHVQRALHRCLGAVLDVVGDVEHLPERRGVTTGDVVLDPLVERHLVEDLPARRERVVERRVARSRDVRVDLLPDRLQVVRHLRERVRPAEEVAELLGPVRLRGVEVVERQAELLRKLLESEMVRVDQLAAVLVDLVVREIAAAGPAAAAHPVGRLVDVGEYPGLLQAIGRSETGEAGPDDNDARVRSGATRGRRPGGAREVAENRRADSCTTCALQEAASRRARFLIGNLRHCLFDCVCKRRTRHSSPSPVLDSQPDRLNVGIQADSATP
jgi:hypothetical protein